MGLPERLPPPPALLLRWISHQTYQVHLIKPRLQRFTSVSVCPPSVIPVKPFLTDKKVFYCGRIGSGPERDRYGVMMAWKEWERIRLRGGRRRRGRHQSSEERRRDDEGDEESSSGGEKWEESDGWWRLERRRVITWKLGSRRLRFISIDTIILINKHLNTVVIIIWDVNFIASLIYRWLWLGRQSHRRCSFLSHRNRQPEGRWFDPCLLPCQSGQHAEPWMVPEGCSIRGGGRCDKNKLCG